MLAYRVYFNKKVYQGEDRNLYDIYVDKITEIGYYSKEETVDFAIRVAKNILGDNNIYYISLDGTKNTKVKISGCKDDEGYFIQEINID